MTNKIKEELELIRGDNQLYIVEDIERWAKKHSNSAIHSALEWDDKKGALEYRYIQIRHLVVLNIRDEKGRPSVVSLVIDRVKPGGGYRDIDDVVRNTELLEVMLHDALAELKRARSKYHYLKELTSVFKAIDKVAAKYPTEEERASA